MTYELVRYAILEELSEGLWMLSSIEAPTVSTVGTDRQRLEREVTRLLKEQLERGGTGDVSFGNIPVVPEVTELTLVLPPPNRTPACQLEKKLVFQVAWWPHGKDLVCAVIPAIDLYMVVPATGDVMGAVEKQLQEALSRLRLTRMLDQLAWSLVPRRVEIVTLQLSVKLPTPLEESRELEEEKAELVLPQVASDVTRDTIPVHDEIDEHVKSLRDALTASGAGSVLLVGDSGSGKTSVFRELVRRRREFGLSKWEFWESSGSRLIAGMTGFGMWQERCGKLVRETQGRELILHLGNLVELLDVGKSLASPLGIASYLKPYLARGQLRMIAECTPEQLAVIEREDPYLLQLFFRVPLPRTSDAALEAILQGIASRTKQPRRQPLHASAISEIGRLHRRFAPYSAYPGRPVRFLRNLLADAAELPPLGRLQVQQAFARETGLPLLLLDESCKLDLDDTRAHFSRRLIGQPAAVKEVIDLLGTVKAGLTRPRKPIASLLFIGPTGVGKTEMAKALAEFLFGNAERIIRFDMSEYADWFAVDRLTGARAREGLLTARVREEPFSVILLDEFEKAHPRFFDLLLQVLGEGRLTDAAGRTADFCSAVVIMTSNLGAATYQRGSLGFDAGGDVGQRAVSHFSGEVRKFLRPEIYNRIDSIVSFMPLDRPAICQIAHRELELVCKRDGIRQRGIDLQVRDDVVEELAGQGWDVRYGARPLKRTIERKLLAPLAQQLNLYAEHAPLQVEVGLQGRRLAVDVKATGSESRSALAIADESIAEQVLALRRQAQTLDGHDAVVELRNRIDELERLQTDLEGRDYVSTEQKKRLESLPMLAALEARARHLLTTARQLEDTIMLQVYRQEEPGPEDRNALQQLRQELEEVVLRVYAINAEDADRVTMGIYSPERHLVLQLARAYLAYAREHFRVSLAAVQPMSKAKRDELNLDVAAACEALGISGVIDESRLSMATPLTGAEPLDNLPTGRIYGILLQLRGSLAYAHMEPEAGRHQFVASSVRASCLVHISDRPIDDFQPPEGLLPELKLDAYPLRRIYDESRADIFDKRLDRHYVWSGKRLEKVLEAAIEDNLRWSTRSLLVVK